MRCDRDCHNCPFLVDPYDPDRHVCIKCGREYSFRRGNLIHPLGLIVLTIIVVVLLEQMPKDSQNSHPTTQSNSRQNYYFITRPPVFNSESLLF